MNELEAKGYKEVEPSYLNDSVWATLRPSDIHGIGVFAIRDIPKGQSINLQGGTGEWLRTDLSKVRAEVRKLIIQRWPYEKDGQPFLSPNDDALLISFVNHCDLPNYNKYNDQVLRDIKKNEEITENYEQYKSIIKIK